MQDTWHRKIDYLRISLTDRCNLRCRYCMPATGVEMKTHAEILTLEEVFRVVQVAVSLGFTKFRLTGGEPLVRKGLVSLVKKMAGLPEVQDIALTTNGVLLASQARELRAAGLNRVNISLDTLQADRYRYITRRGDLRQVLAGMEAALAAGLAPVKINVVAVKGFNDDEILAFARLTLNRALHIRFIELMPIGESSSRTDHIGLTIEEIKQIIQDEYELVPASVAGSGPAAYEQIPGAVGTLGFIGALSNHFCGQCNRLRLTADGKLRPCLHKDLEYDLKEVLRGGGGQAELADVFDQAVRFKPARHAMGQDNWGQERLMSQIGG